MDSNLAKLLTVDKLAYGRYAFKFELLNDRVKESARDDMILKAISCGEELALRYINKNELDIFSLIKKYNLNFRISKDTVDAYGRNLLGFFNYPNTITIMDSALKNILLAANECSFPLDEDTIKRIVCSHELFHYLENKNPKEFYTKTAKCVTGHFFKFERKSHPIILSEIGAMAFASKLNNLSFSPYILDYLLLYKIDKKKASDLYEAVTED